MTYPSALAAVVSYLNACAIAAADPVRAYGGVPAQRPTRFVRAVQTGTSLRSVAHRDARITVECWETSEDRAERLGDLVQGWLIDMDTPSGRVPQGPAGWLGGPFSQPDPDSNTPRSVMTVIVRQRRQ